MIRRKSRRTKEREHIQALKDYDRDYQIKLKEIESKHTLAMSDQENKATLELEKAVTVKEKEIAKLEAKVEMLLKIQTQNVNKSGKFFSIYEEIFLLIKKEETRLNDSSSLVLN